MKEFIDKLISELKEEHERCINRYGVVGGNKPAMEVKQCMVIVNELAEEYKVSEMPTGWIPCSERLPKDDSMCLVTVEYSSGRIEVDYGWFDRVGVSWYVGMHEFRTTNVHAWMPLPAPYTEGE